MEPLNIEEKIDELEYGKDFGLPKLAYEPLKQEFPIVARDQKGIQLHEYLMIFWSNIQKR